MKINIYNRYSGEVIFSHEEKGNSLRLTVENAINKNVSLQGANLQDANLQGADLCAANLQGANLQDANLQGADLCAADLCAANLQGSNLKGTRLYNASLQGADLCGANLYDAYLYNASLQGADLCGANLNGATYGEATLDKGVLYCVGFQWPVFFFDNHLKIGCEMHTINEWEGFTKEEIENMDKEALAFWELNKDVIIKLARSR